MIPNLVREFVIRRIDTHGLLNRIYVDPIRGGITCEPVHNAINNPPIPQVNASSVEQTFPFILRPLKPLKIWNQTLV